uniref:Uncharacterized protein n=1 Tax=Candidatus Kentrum sp. SD TaxID=2126332 RepID=A0A451BHN3_9GAMM|nr:MAG: hypothetical protein BECKSD772D_GA0070982_100187 [Candidatus Kentron sp. SD]
MVDARSDPPYGPESGLLFHSNKEAKINLILVTHSIRGRARKIICLFPARLYKWIKF